MDKPLSLYLDLIRFFAAVAVLLAHASVSILDGHWLQPIKFAGHDAVIVFFVLSGFVISYVSSEKESEITTFIISRISRLYSVIIPAIILTLILDGIGKQLDLSLYEDISYSQYFFTIFSNFFLINELQFNSVQLFSNEPFWSLGYEYWYYIIFAAYYFFQGTKRWFLLTILFATVGIKVLIMMPIWWAGVYVFYLSKNYRLPKFSGWILFIGSIIGYVLLKYYHITGILYEYTQHHLDEYLYNHLKWSRGFLGDYFIALFVSMNFLGVSILARGKSISFALGTRLIRYFASHTFALYLFHAPMLKFYFSLTHNNYLTILMTLVTVLSIGKIVEQQKYTIKAVLLNLQGKYL